MALSKATGVVAKVAGDAPTGGDDVQDISLGFSDGKAIWLWATINTSNGVTVSDAVMAWGISDGTNHYSVCSAVQDNQGTSNANRYHKNKALIFLDTAGALIAECTASFSGSNLRLTWQTNVATQFLIHYLVLGGTDITNAKVINTYTAKTSTGIQARTGVGFKPDFAFWLTTGNATDPATGAANTSVATSWGCAADKPVTIFNSNDRMTGGILSEDNVAIASAFTYLFSVNGVEPVAMHHNTIKSGAPGVNGRFNVVSWDVDGYTETWPVAAGNAWYFGAMLLKGLQYDIKVDLCPTSTGDDVQTGLGFTPQALWSVMTAVPSGGGGIADISMGIGACTSTSDEHACWVGDNDAALISESDRRSSNTSHVLRLAPGAAPTIDVEAIFKSFNVGGFTQEFTTAPAATAQQGWIAFGPALPPLTWNPEMPDKLPFKHEIVGY